MVQSEGRPDGRPTSASPGAVRTRDHRSGRSAAPSAAPSVVVTCELTLVAQTVAAALGHRGVPTTSVPWWMLAASLRTGRSDLVDPALLRRADVVLLIGDLASGSVLRDMRELGPACRRPWVVMSDAAEGPEWGGALEAGARAVLPGSTSLAGMVEALQVVARGGTPLTARKRADLVHSWRRLDERRHELRDRLRSLSPREEQVLGMLYEGTTVSEIAGRLAVSETTVRSQVRAVLRKLGVDSQLAAVAALRELRQAGEGR
jgi:RNA polymerase sigma factor (sigma-70 family)